MIKIILNDDREIKVELDYQAAPLAAENFVKLVNEHFYDGVIFHRIIANFMIQTGGYYIDDMSLKEKPKVAAIKGEFAQNGVENKLKHQFGTISMARTNDMNSASSQFFICAADCPHLDGAYAAFGKVKDPESLKVVKELSEVETTSFYYFNDFPVEPIIIKKVIVVD